MAMMINGGMPSSRGLTNIAYDWKRVFLFRSKVSVYGGLLRRWQFVNRQIILSAVGADALEYRNYATDKELFEYKLRGNK